MLLPNELKIQGVILTDQVKCLDWVARRVQFIELAPEIVTEEVKSKIEALVL